MFSVAVKKNIYILSRFDRGVSDIPVTRCRYYVWFKKKNQVFIFDMFSYIARKYPKILLLDFFERGLKGQNIGE